MKPIIYVKRKKNIVYLNLIFLVYERNLIIYDEVFFIFIFFSELTCSDIKCDELCDCCLICFDT